MTGTLLGGMALQFVIAMQYNLDAHWKLSYGATSLQNLANLTLWLSIIIPKLLLWSRAPYKTKGEIKDLFSLCKSSLAYPILELHEILSQNVHTTRSEILPSLSNFAQKPWCEWMRTIKTQESDARGTPAAPIPRPPICPTRSKEHFRV